MVGRGLVCVVALAATALATPVTASEPGKERVAPSNVVDVSADPQSRSFDLAHNAEKDEYLGVWRDFDGTGDLGIVGVLLDAEGSVIAEPFEVAALRPGPNGLVKDTLFSPHVEYNPATNQYLVVMLRNSSDPVTPADDRRGAEVLGQLVSDSGALVGAEVSLNPPLGDPGQVVCVPRYPDLAVDTSTNGFVLVYARTYASADGPDGACDGLDPAESVTVVQALDASLGLGARVDFPSINSSGSATPRVAHNPVTSTFMVTQPYKGVEEVGPANRNGLRFAAQIFDSTLGPLGAMLEVDVDPIDPSGTGPVDDARPVADPSNGNWFVLSSAQFFAPNWTNLLGPDGESLRSGTRFDLGRPTSVAAVGDGTFVFSTEAGDLAHIRGDGTMIHPASVFPSKSFENSAVALGPRPADGGSTRGMALGLGSDGVVAARIDAVAPAVVPLTPARLLDTRDGPEFSTIDGEFEGGGQIIGERAIELDVRSRGGVPADADAVLLNVAAVGSSGDGFVTTYPCDASRRPITANLNYPLVGAASSAAMSRISAAGTVCLYTSRTVHLVVDVNGYVPAEGSVESLVPARLLETRTAADAVTVDGQSQGIGRVASGVTVPVVVAGRAGIDDDADAVVVNVAAIRPSRDLFLTVHPCGEDRPTAANLNATANAVVNNLVVAKVSDAGTICVYTSGPTDLVVDVAAFVPSLGGLLSILPARLLETRVGTDLETVDGVDEGIGRVAVESITELEVAGRGGVADEARGAMLNVAAIQSTTAGFLTVYPCDADERPQAANLNFGASQVVSNAVFVKLSASGTVCIYSTSRADLAVDVVGYVVDN